MVFMHTDEMSVRGSTATLEKVTHKNRLAPVQEKPTLITKSYWDSLAKDKKRKWKDGTKLMLCKVPGQPAGKWVKVFWNQ